MSRKEFENTEPKQLGSLYERMQRVMSLMCSEEYRDQIPHDLWHAVWDLKSEVEEYPKQPSRARRGI